jgi:hypothetical protein
LKTRKFKNLMQQMKNYLFIALLFFLFINCDNHSFTSPSSNEMNQIIRIVFENDLEFETNKTNLNLVKIVVDFNDSINKMRSGKVNFKKLLNLSKNKSFKKTDSLYLKFQNENLITKIFDKSELVKLSKNKKVNSVFTENNISIPLFSLDNKLAYVEVTHYTENHGGNGSSFYYVLRKINKKWRIIDSGLVWIM